MSADTLQVLSGATAMRMVDYPDAIAGMRDMFAALHAGRSVVFPPVAGHGSRQGTRFGVKAGYDGVRGTPGLKIGSYWPGNSERGHPNHGSTTILLDDETGFPVAIVEATGLNALRTAASDAVGTDALARPDATVLALVGTGNQAFHEARAIALVRRLDAVLVTGRDFAKAEALAGRLRGAGLPATATTTEEAIGRADILVTATTARAPLFPAEWVRPGTHVSAMGADGPGKQELPPELLAAATLVADLPAQSLAIGEFQHVRGTPAADRIAGIAAVLAGAAQGRASADAITVYDSSGFGLQDLAIAALALERARAAGLTAEVDFR